ncbi:tRNA 2-selenouridine synthase [Paragonimus westermani]|uniref:tRNA 2-selenouridine synthase n=1 Tax=Paragonimus westermani TaxID=34504 RepID=A0A8T0DZ57_9TREM|nr:tRNA 2-selenouridine synthase [Paragonimus westermani]
MPDDSQNTSCTLITQRQFESALHQKFTSDSRWQTTPRVWIECESRSVGPACHLSDGLWSRLRDTQNTHRVWLDVPEEARVAWIIESYSEFTKNPALLEPMLCSLAKYHPTQRIAQWRSWIDAADFTSLVTGLLQHHYDPLYSKSRKSVMEGARLNGLVHHIPLSSVDACTVRSQLLPRLLSLACEHEHVHTTKQRTA